MAYSNVELSKKSTDEANKGRGYSLHLALIAVACMVGSTFQFGFNIAVVNAPKEAILGYYKQRGTTVSEMTWAIIVAIFAQGGAVGAVVGPLIADRFGRQKALLLNNISAIITGILVIIAYFAVSPMSLLASRITAGLNAGCNAVISPCYLSETAPVHLRGSFGILNNLGITIGIFMAQLLGIPQIFGTSSRWHFLLGFTLVPVILQLILLPFCPESPRFLLIMKGDVTGALQAMKKLRHNEDFKIELETIKAEAHEGVNRVKLSIKELFTTPYLRMPLLISIMMQFANQATGINGVVGYSTSLFKSIGVSNSALATCGLGFVCLVVPIAAYRTVESKGRRIMLLFGLAGMALSYIILTIAFILQNNYGIDGAKYLAVICLVIIMGVYQCGPAPIPWFIVGELFCQRSRGAAFCVSGVTNWMLTFFILLVYPPLEKAAGQYTFLGFAAVAILLIIFTYKFVPETKGRATEDIIKEFKSLKRTKSDSSGRVFVLSCFVTWIACFCGGSFSFGFSLGSLSVPGKMLQKFGLAMPMKTVDVTWQCMLMAFAGGSFIGVVAGAKLASFVGRRYTLLICCCIQVLGSIIGIVCCISYSLSALFVAKFFSGVGAGVAAMISPLYLSGIPRQSLKSHFVASHHFGIVLGMLVSQMVLLPVFSTSAVSLVILFGIGFCFAALGLLCTIFAQESYNVLEMNGSCARTEDHDSLLSPFEKLNRVTDSDKAVVYHLKINGESRQPWHRMLYIELKSSAHFRKCVILIFVLQFFVPLISLNLFNGYFVQSKLCGPRYCTGTFFAISATLMLAGPAVFFFLARHISRKMLLLVGLYGMACLHVMITISISLQYKFQVAWPMYINLLCIAFISLMYQIGPGPLSWIFSIEAFSYKWRTLMSASSATTYLLNSYICVFAIRFTKVEMMHFFHLILAAAGLFSLVFIFFVFPDINFDIPSKDIPNCKKNERLPRTVLVQDEDSVISEVVTAV